MSKQTGWVIAATEGATVDGRTITKAWIDDMAAQYSVDEYTALIWPEHFRSSWAPFDGKNWGVIDEVKAAKFNGKVRLFVKLTANDYLLDANKDGQKLFMSIEPDIDYKGSGRCYLRGLAVTDTPASTGTTRLKFSVGNDATEHEYSQLETLELNDFIQGDTEQQNEKSLYSLFAGWLRNQSPNLAPETSEDDPMNKEQYDGLIGQFSTLGTRLDSLEGQVSQFSKQTTEITPPKDDEETSPAGVVTSDQFSVLGEQLTGFSTKLDKLATDFAALKLEVPGQEPNPGGLNEPESCTV
ncbi:GPO family capsid scaffolding protein [Shewanella sp. VB17]|uniref:GPO family capsid scaffolding protein n=1 Tax=Shewanella sp. VB17 TaxID=2739432 RepID=UPI00156611AF|nr:GPO family capsid scaffolding protein [Shewanella sp. VB17]NRD73250.1 GPO family capsid scaffolding protein [Shewanella sp. VB17]